MASPQVLAAVKAFMAAEFTETPVYFPNEAPPKASPFVAVQFPVATEEQASFGAPGSNVFREEGAIRFVVVVRAGSGTEKLGSIALALRILFRNARFDGVRCYAPSSPFFDDRGDDAGAFRASFAVPYDFDLFA